MKQQEERAKKDAEIKRMADLKKNDSAEWERRVRAELDVCHISYLLFSITYANWVEM